MLSFVQRAPSHLPLSPEALGLVAARFRALGDPARLGLLDALLQGEASVQELVLATGLGQPNVSKHLALLRREGIVARRSEGNRAIYRVVDPSVRTLCRIVCGGLAEGLARHLHALPSPPPARTAARPSRSRR